MKWQQVYKFWFKDNGQKQWFQKSTSFDREIRRKFLATYEAAVRGELSHWRTSAKGRLAEIIVLDQFARNMFRGEAQAFAYDPLALALAQEAIRAGAPQRFSKFQKLFLYLPFMHSESKKVQVTSVRLFKTLKDKEVTYFANDHKKVVDRFGRFPHRNAARKLKSTPAEKKFMLTHKGY